jgi:hypothetical protein
MSNTMISAREALIPGSAYDKNKIKPPGRNKALSTLL